MSNDIPATESEMVIGAKVKCIFAASGFYGQTGVIVATKLNGGFQYDIKWDKDGVVNSPLGNASSYTIIRATATPIDIPATVEQMVKGARVKCIFATEDFGKTGTVDDDTSGHYRIKWDDGSIDTYGWSEPSSFTILPPLDDTKSEMVELPSTPAPAPEPAFNFDKYNGRLAKIKG